MKGANDTMDLTALFQKIWELISALLAAIKGALEAE